jgi:hypothetical protein
MKVNSSTRFLAIAALVGALACAGNTAREDTDEAAAARDTTTSDTLGQQNPPGYRGMERDTTISPTGQPSDTFMQNQGTGQAQDTSGYSGMERVDTSGQANQQNNQQGQTDTTSQQGQIDTTSQQGQTDTTSFRNDTTGAAGGAGAGRDTTSMTGDSSWTRSGDTTGYNPSQQPKDSVSR